MRMWDHTAAEAMKHQDNSGPKGHKPWSNRSHNVAGAMRNRNLRKNPEFEIHKAAEGLNRQDPWGSRSDETVRATRRQGNRNWRGCRNYKGSRSYNTEKPWINWNWSPRSQEAADNRGPRKYTVFERNFLKDLDEWKNCPEPACKHSNVEPFNSF